jgi:hypothetical protein
MPPTSFARHVTLAALLPLLSGVLGGCATTPASVGLLHARTGARSRRRRADERCWAVAAVGELC